MPSGAEDLAAAKAALAIVQMANKQGWLDKLKDIFKTKHKILVLGSTGVGKSNFIDSLQTLVPKAIDHLNRTEWATSQRVRLAGVIFDLIDTPGQDAHRPRRFEAATEALRESSFGMINVVAWGYHEYRTGQAEALMPNGQPNPSWLEKHRAIELNSAAEWAPLMTARPSYVITLVTKADLWWAQRDEVIRYYWSVCEVI